jgi:hypothetical protein
MVVFSIGSAVMSWVRIPWRQPHHQMLSRSCRLSCNSFVAQALGQQSVLPASLAWPEQRALQAITMHHGCSSTFCRLLGLLASPPALLLVLLVLLLVLLVLLLWLHSHRRVMPQRCVHLSSIAACCPLLLLRAGMHVVSAQYRQGCLAVTETSSREFYTIIHAAPHIVALFYTCVRQ